VPAQPATTDLRFVATEFKFDPMVARIPAGQKVRVTLENKGVVEHDVFIDAVQFRLHAKPGQTATAELTIDKPGEYEIICSIPGHMGAGMKGTLTVGDVAPAAVAQTSTIAAPKAAAPKPLPANIAPLPAPQMALPTLRNEPATVKVNLETQEITATLADGVGYKYWTFNGTVPGPMIRVRQGDSVELTLSNNPTSQVTHSIDLHAVTGPGGGAKVTQVPAGESATFRFEALNPGVYVYHCATPMVAHHIASGMYGLIVVEPPEGLPVVDREFYVMQGDFYLEGQRTESGLREFSVDKMLDERPDYVVFNGSVGAVSKDDALTAKVGETVRIFFGVGGPNLSSSFHVIGEIFDRVYPEGALANPLRDVQTTTVPSGGATMVEFKVDVPGTYILVDHSLGRLEKGAAGMLEVTGEENPRIFETLHHGSGGGGGH
jgi:nitrite reductase (NO-forming)